MSWWWCLGGSLVNSFLSDKKWFLKVNTPQSGDNVPLQWTQRCTVGRSVARCLQETTKVQLVLVTMFLPSFPPSSQKKNPYLGITREGIDDMAAIKPSSPGRGHSARWLPCGELLRSVAAMPERWSLLGLHASLLLFWCNFTYVSLFCSSWPPASLFGCLCGTRDEFHTTAWLVNIYWPEGLILSQVIIKNIC